MREVALQVSGHEQGSQRSPPEWEQQAPNPVERKRSKSRRGDAHYDQTSKQQSVSQDAVRQGSVSFYLLSSM